MAAHWGAGIVESDDKDVADETEETSEYTEELSESVLADELEYCDRRGERGGDQGS